MTKQGITYKEKLIRIYKSINDTSDNNTLMVGDVLDWIKLQNKELTGYYDGNLLTYYSADVLEMRKELRQPIDNQSDECIDYIYSLITK